LEILEYTSITREITRDRVQQSTNPSTRVASHMSSEKKQKISSVFGHVQAVPNDVIFNLKTLYESDTHPQKVDLGIGGKFASYVSTIEV